MSLLQLFDWSKPPPTCEVWRRQERRMKGCWREEKRHWARWVAARWRLLPLEIWREEDSARNMKPKRGRLNKTRNDPPPPPKRDWVISIGMETWNVNQNETGRNKRVILFKPELVEVRQGQGHLDPTKMSNKGREGDSRSKLTPIASACKLKPN